jgi:coproporphyrinogen III oxidase-like Fe-S oxidoreductase
MQSADRDDLRLLDRRHLQNEVAQAVQWARSAGFDNLSLDLIYGLPDQSLARWERTWRQHWLFNPTTSRCML